MNVRQTSLGYNGTYSNHVNDNGRYDDPHVEMKRHATKEDNDNAAALSLYEESSIFCVGDGFKNLFDSNLKVASMPEPRPPSTTVASKSIKKRTNSEITSVNDETHAISVCPLQTPPQNLLSMYQMYPKSAPPKPTKNILSHAGGPF